MGKIVRLLRQLACTPIIVYQWCIRPVLRPSCRFSPSCSEYALTAIRTFGIVKGMRLACFRLLRCHPWSEAGVDPVLPNQEKL